MTDSKRTKKTAPPAQKGKIGPIPVQDIFFGTDVTTRVKRNDATVAEYAECMQEYAERLKEGTMKDGDGFPPVMLFTEDEQTYFLADGSHRVWAASKCGHPAILAEVRKGGEKDALRFACGANYNHGLPRTNDDKRNAVRTYLENFPIRKRGTQEDSTRTIAKACNVSHMLVSTILQELAHEKAELKKPLEEREAYKEKRAKERARIEREDRRKLGEAPAPAPVNIYTNPATTPATTPVPTVPAPTAPLAARQSWEEIVDTAGEIGRRETAPDSPHAAAAETAPVQQEENRLQVFESMREDLHRLVRNYGRDAVLQEVVLVFLHDQQITLADLQQSEN